MVTRREVLKGTAAVSIGAIAAAHGAAPAEAASSLDLGYGQLTGGAVGGFWKQADAFQIAVKFDKTAGEVFIKEDPAGGVAVFAKVFEKHWVTGETQLIDAASLDLKTADLQFSKFHAGGAELFLKDLNGSSLFAKFVVSKDENGNTGLEFLKFEMEID